MNYCIYQNREITINQYEDYELNLTRPYIECKNGFELVYVSKSIDNRRSHFRYKSIPEWYLEKYGSKGESELHLKIKEHLYKLLNELKITCQMEYKIENLIPDVVELNRKIAYEIVVGYINEKIILERTEKLKEKGYITFWYIHENLNKFKHLIDEKKGCLYMIDFSPDRKKIHKYFRPNKYFIE